MHILVVGDVHFSTYSSILRGRGEVCSTRLSNMIDSLNWVEEQANLQNVDTVLYLGDFFDKPDLTAEEITMLQLVKWSNKKHICIVGNHESGVASLEYSSTKALQNFGFNIIDKVSYFKEGNCAVYLLPYISEDNRKTITKYIKKFPETSNSEKKLIFSHNDIKGIQYGAFESKTGFEKEDIEKNCDLFINGHLHNGSSITNKIINLGNLTGQNFTEDAFRYKHNVMVLDTETLQYNLIENPYSIKFYKLEINEKKDLDIFSKLGTQPVISIKCNQDLKDDVLKNLDEVKPLAYKVIYYVNTVESKENEIKLNDVDHLKQFSDFVLQTIGINDIIKEELSEVLK